MEITTQGTAKDKRGRAIRIVATDLPGRYPVLGVQLARNGKEISKDGLRLYTREGKFYANGGDTVDQLDVVEFSQTRQLVKMSYVLNGEEIATRFVDADSDEHNTLENDGWEAET